MLPVKTRQFQGPVLLQRLFMLQYAGWGAGEGGPGPHGAAAASLLL